MTNTTPRSKVLPYILTLVSCIFSCPNMLMAQSATTLTENPGFESGISGWNNVHIDVAIRTRNWTPAATGPESRLGTKLASLNGDGFLGQWLALPATSRFQIVQIQAARKSYVPGADALSEGWAGFGITYYDQNWQAIDEASLEILGLNLAVPTKSYSGLSSYMFGTVVPLKAKFAMIWCTNLSLHSEVLVDDFRLFEYVPIVTDPTNLAPPLIFPSVNTNGLLLSYYEAATGQSLGLRVPFLLPSNVQKTLIANNFYLPSTGIVESSRAGRTASPTISIGDPGRDISGHLGLRVAPGRSTSCKRILAKPQVGLEYWALTFMVRLERSSDQQLQISLKTSAPPMHLASSRRKPLT